MERTSKFEEKLTRLKMEQSACLKDELAEDDGNRAVFVAEWDEGGVFFYQAFKDEIADWALQNQKLGGPHFKPGRMTWFKPSFGWMMFRSGYGRKANQTRVLKIKLSHEIVASILHRVGFGNLKVQWDPERDIHSVGEKRPTQPRKMLRKRAIQIGVAQDLSALYANSILSIQDVTELAHKVGAVHNNKKAEEFKKGMDLLQCELPTEKPYIPRCSEATLQAIGLIPGPLAAKIINIGRGRAARSKIED